MRPKTKNKILKGITTTAIINLILAGCCLDSENLIIPFAMMGVSLIWLFIFWLANGER
jgi:hypothetical protein